MSFQTEISRQKLLGRYGNNNEVDDIRIDRPTASLTTIDYAHHKKHAGHGYYAQVVDTSMGDNDTLSISFKTPDNPRVHLLILTSIKVAGNIALWEGTTWTQGSGSGITIYNRNRRISAPSSTLLENRQQSAFTANNQVMANVGGLDTGAASALEQLYSFGSISYSVIDRQVAEWILRPNTQYSIVFTANGGSNGGFIGLDWYEHTNLH